MKTKEDLEKLKLDWSRDPCWDIYETEGFEAHKDELKQFQQTAERNWDIDDNKRMQQLSVKYGVPGNHKLANIIYQLERRLIDLESD